MNEHVKKPLSYDMLPAPFRKELEACSWKLDGSSLILDAPEWVSPHAKRTYLFLLLKHLEKHNLSFGENIFVTFRIPIGVLLPNLF